MVSTVVCRVIHLLIITPAPAPARQKGERVSLVLWMSHNRVHFSRVQGGLVRVVSDCILGGTPVAVCVLHNGGGDTLWVLILIYESDITISNESGVAWWWSAWSGHFLPPSVLWSQGAIIYTNGRNVFSTRTEEIVPPSPALSAPVFAEQLPGYAVHRVQRPGDSGRQMTKAGCGFYLTYCDIRWMQE